MLCECGQPRNERASACTSCLWLDGATEAERRVIEVLRTYGGSCTREALACETQMPERRLRRALAKLRRLERLVAGTDGEHATYALRTECRSRRCPPPL
jgi:hypothetical protein